MKVIAAVDPFTYAVHAFKSLLLKNTGFGAITFDLGLPGGLLDRGDDVGHACFSSGRCNDDDDDDDAGDREPPKTSPASADTRERLIDAGADAVCRARFQERDGPRDLQGVAAPTSRP